jgi:hypothetical protein
MAGDDRSEAAKVTVARSPWRHERERVRVRWGCAVVRSDLTGSVDLTEGSDRWAPPRGFSVNCFNPRDLSVKMPLLLVNSPKIMKNIFLETKNMANSNMSLNGIFRNKSY